MPRRRDLADQHLYNMNRTADYGCLNPLFRGVADTDLIREQWDFLVRVAASLKNRTWRTAKLCGAPRYSWPGGG
jgi:TnpA family transposase